MRPLDSTRRPRFALAAVAVLAALALLFAPIHPGPDQAWVSLGMDLAHIPLFAGVTYALYIALGGAAQQRRGLMGAGLASFLVIIVSETLQPYFGRTESSQDAINGIIGIGLAILSATKPREMRLNTVWRWYGGALMAALALTSAALPMFSYTMARSWQTRTFPVLADSSSREQLPLWVKQPDDTDLVQFDPDLRVEIAPGQAFSGLSLYLNGRARDWSGYGTLRLVIENLENNPRTLGLRLDDDGDVSKLSGRYQSALDLQPGRNNLPLPLAEIQAGPRGRSLNLRHIRRLALFTGQDDPLTHRFRLISIQLTPTDSP